MTNAPNGESARLAATLDHWKRSLLDLTRRNRAIHFRPTPVSTLLLKDELPADLYRRLVLKRGKMRFKAEETSKTVEDGETGAAGGDEVAAEAQAASAASPEAYEPPDLTPAPFAPSIPQTAEPLASTSAPPSDAFLQTTATPEQLDRGLRRLEEQARLSLEEQGVNTLFLALGMLHFTDDAGPLRAPLLLVPAVLERTSARAGYSLAASDDDPLLNPALAEYLRRLHRLDLPDLPERGDDEDDYDLGHWLDEVRAAIREQRGWEVRPDCVVGLFSFQKFVMYKDLEAHGAAIQASALVRRLVSRQAGSAPGAGLPGLPPEVQALDLDRDFPPEATYQVVDADASQLRAIAAASRGHDLVIEGPPGTGKSQTITNLIAQALAQGQRVLFVAEKMAALEVVHRRLLSVGLGEFCLELHSTKANKRAVIAALRAALDASLQRPAPPAGAEAAAVRLPAARQALNAYARAVHAPHGALGVSPYYAYGELEGVLNAPRLRYSGPAEQATRDELDRAVRALDALAAAAGPVGVPAQHPWRDTARTFYTEADLDEARALADAVTARLDDLAPRASELQAALDLRPLRTLPEIEAALHLADYITQSPGAPAGVLRSPAWDTPPAAALGLIARGRRIGELWARVRQRLLPTVLAYDHSADIAYVEHKAQGALSFLAVLDGRWRDIRRRWLGYRAPGYAPSLLEQAQEMRVVGRLQQERLALAAAEAEARALFGALWKGEDSHWEALEAYVRWVVGFRALAQRHALAGRALGLAAQRAPILPAAETLRPRLAAARQALTVLCAYVGWPAGYLHDAPLPEISARARGLADHLALAPRWAAFESARALAAATLAGEVLPAALSGDVPFPELNAAFRRAFWQRWLAAAVAARDELRQFSTAAHEQRVLEFRALDEQVLVENRAALVARLRADVQQRLQAPEAAAGLPFLRREMARQRGLSPLRRTLHHAGAAIRAIKPCFMMSPLSVAQFLEGGAPGFDLVIFDEASQLPPEDAVGAIARGQQLVVVGDPKQLPPTNFFAVMSGQANAPLGDDGLPLFEDSESILEEYLGAGVPGCRLTWHYRSLHESLIAFSNVSFYDASLNTFPSVDLPPPAPASPPSPSGRGAGGEGEPPAPFPPFSLRDGGPEGLGPPSGLAFTYVPDGVYTGQGLNQAEARAVADAIVEHARAYPDLSLGVGTFNLRQQQAILDEIEQRRRADPSLEPFFAAREEGAFFVKNLENIQGDERDVIFISVTYARDAAGRLRYNFGPLNMQNGWRRLNVLVTRARRHMRVFASIRGEDLDANAESAGAQLLRRFLLYAELGRLDDARLAEAVRARQTAFERHVQTALSARGLDLEPQVGLSGYRIDVAVRDPARPGAYLCGLEFDGLAYAAAPATRDRDRLCQQVLAARGWTLHRIWSTDWFKDRTGQIERLLSLVEAARAAQDPAAPASPAVPAAQPFMGRDPAYPEAPESLAAPPPPPLPDAYVRPEVPAYRFAPGEGQFAGRDLLQAPASQLRGAVARVVAAEYPLHLDDLAARVAGLWGVRLGSRIRARIETAIHETAQAGQVELRGEFAWAPGGEARARSRAGTRIPPDRIAPEEVRAAILLILGTGAGFPLSALTNEVRALFGYGRGAEALAGAVAAQAAALVAQGLVGEGSQGLRLRE